MAPPASSRKRAAALLPSLMAAAQAPPQRSRPAFGAALNPSLLLLRAHTRLPASTPTPHVLLRAHELA